MGLGVVGIRSKDVSGRKQEWGTLDHTLCTKNMGTPGSRGWAGGSDQHRIDPKVPFIAWSLCSDGEIMGR